MRYAYPFLSCAIALRLIRFSSSPHVARSKKPNNRPLPYREALQQDLPLGHDVSTGGRLLPVLLGHDLDDDEGDDANSPYLLQLDDDRPQQASLDAPRDRRQPLLTNVPNEDAAVRLHGEETEGDGTAVVVGLAVAEREGEGSGGALVAEAGGGVIVATRDGAEEEEEEVGDVDVVVETRLVSEWTRCLPTLCHHAHPYRAGGFSCGSSELVLVAE